MQPLHTQHVKLIEFESHGVFYLDMDSKSNCSHEQVPNEYNLIGSAAREDASAKSTKDSTHGPDVSFLTKGRSYIVRSCKKDHLRFLYEYAVVWIQNTVNVGSFKKTAPLNRIFEEMRFIKKSIFFDYVFVFFSVSVNILTTAVLHFLTCTWRNKKLGRALSIQVEPWQDLNIQAH